MKRYIVILLTLVVTLLTGCGIPEEYHVFDNTRDFYKEVPKDLADRLAESIGPEEKNMFDSYEYMAYNKDEKSVEVVGVMDGITLRFLYKYNEELNDFSVMLME